MNKLRNIIKESLVCVKSIYERNLTITEKGINTLTDNVEEEILKEFVHKDNLPKKMDIVTVIVDEMVKYRTDKRFKLNARMSGKNWTIANWLAKAIRKLIEGE